MCIPHSNPKKIHTKKVRKVRKKSNPFDENLLNPDPSFIDERIKTKADVPLFERFLRYLGF